MKIKNTSAKIIGIKGFSLMPDAVIEVDKSVAYSAPILALAQLGQVEIIADPKPVAPAPKAEVNVKKEVVSEDKSETEPVKKATKKSTK